MQHLGFTRVGDPHGRPLAIVHGWGCDSSFLLPIANMFRERDVFLIDLPGYGESAHLSSYAEDLLSTTFLLINTLPDGADVISWSFGTLYVLRALSLLSDPTWQNADFSQSSLKKPRYYTKCPLTQATFRNSLSFSADPRLQSVHQSFTHESIQENLMIAQALHRALHSSLQVRNMLLEQLFDDDEQFKKPVNLGNGTYRPTLADLEPNSSCLPASLAASNKQSFQHNNEAKQQNGIMNTNVQDPTRSVLYAHPDLKAETCAQPKESSSSLKTKSYTNVYGVKEPQLDQDESKQSNLDEIQTYDLLKQIKIPRINSLITVCGTPRFPADPTWPGINPMRILKINTGLTTRRLKTVLNLFYRMQFSVTDPHLMTMFENCLKSSPPISEAVLRSGIHQVSFMDERPALQHLRIPTLHMFGAKDQIVPYQIAKFLPNDKLHSSYIFPYSSHNPFLTEPKEFEQQIRLFFERISTF